MLSEHHLLERIRQTQEDGATGILELMRNGQSISFSFKKGLIAAGSGTIESLRLGRILSGKGVLQTSEIAKLLAVTRRKHTLFGERAVSSGLINEIELREGVREQIVQLVIHALTNDFEIRSFKNIPREFYLPARLDADQIIVELARADSRSFSIDGNKLIYLKNRHIIPNLPLYPEELYVLSQLQTPRTIQDLAAAAGMDVQRLSKILSVLDTLQLIAQLDALPDELAAALKQNDKALKNLSPEIKNLDLSEKIEAFHNPSSFASEQFKSLKVKISELARGSQVKVIAVSSPDANDGKSLVSFNLAISLSKDPGKRVALLDCDLRNPSLHRFLGLQADPGLAEFIDGSCPEPHCYMRRLEQLHLMTAGSATANPVDLLSKSRMQDLITRLRTEFDTIILDCPPSGPISDAQILTGLADRFLMVVRCGKTTYGSMKVAFRNLDMGKLTGLIFNDVKPMIFNTQYDHKYYYHRSRQRYPYAKAKTPHRRKTYLE